MIKQKAAVGTEQVVVHSRGEIVQGLQRQEGSMGDGSGLPCKASHMLVLYNWKTEAVSISHFQFQYMQYLLVTG